jgi:hypothetical protein
VYSLLLIHPDIVDFELANSVFIMEDRVLAMLPLVVDDQVQNEVSESSRVSYPPQFVVEALVSGA